MENINACVAVDVLLSSGIVTLTSTFMKEMKRSGYGALSLVTPGGKSNITISKCIFKDTSMNAMRGRIVKIVSGNGNAGMVKIGDGLIKSTKNRKVALTISLKYRIELFNVTFISLR